MIRCLHCGAETTNGLALCEQCRAAVSIYLEFIPIYFSNLTRWRPGRAGSRPVPGSREPKAARLDIGGDAVTRALDDVGNELTARSLALVEDRPHLSRLLDRLHAADLDETQVVRWLCLGFTRYLTSISTLDWCGEFVIALKRHEAVLRSMTERVVPGWYAGSCRQCTAPTYVVPGLTWVTCGTCGATTHARDHLEVVLKEARTWNAPPMRLAEAIVALVDGEASVPRLHKRISKWGERGRIETIRTIDVDGDPVGPKRYRLGDVIDALLAEGLTGGGSSAEPTSGSPAC